jgi:mannose-6-phosphate isomerase-like protein (cupin superfamily)
MGELVACKVSAAQTAGAFSVWELVALPGWERDLYIHHAVDECFYVVDGPFDIGLDDPDRIVRASSGDLVYVPRGVARSLRNSVSRAGRLLIVQTPGRAARRARAPASSSAATGRTPPAGRGTAGT